MAAAETSLKDIETAVMSIREDIMQYFKGGCVVRLTNSPLVQNRPNRPREFQYQRAQNELQQVTEYYLDSALLFTLQRETDTITFNMNTFNRSEQLKEVYKGVREFMRNYLMGVEVQQQEEDIIYA